MKNQIIAINTEKSIEARLDQIIDQSEVGLPKTIFSNFESVLVDEKKLINWEGEESHPCYEGYRLNGSTLNKLPPYQVPALPQAFEELKKYKQKLEIGLVPLEKTKDQRNHLELFKQAVLLLINCYPTYCKKDEKFKQDTTLAFLTFFEGYPIAVITKTIHEWIKTEREFPMIADLTVRIEKKMRETAKKLNCLEKIISKSTSN